ncbi:hypothetical protein D3C71_1965100 [compost metagenome]
MFVVGVARAIGAVTGGTTAADGAEGVVFVFTSSPPDIDAATIRPVPTAAAPNKAPESMLAAPITRPTTANSPAPPSEAHPLTPAKQ